MSTYASSEVSASIYTPVTTDTRRGTPSTAPTDDELDVMCLTSSPVRKSTRLYKRLSSGDTTTNSRKRAHIVEDGVQKDQDTKRLKMDDKKSLTLHANLKRLSLEAAKRRWFQKHQPLFEPLLPQSKSFFTNLQKEFDLIQDKKMYVPQRAIDEQPKLVQGGTMKDYQLEGLAYLIWMYNNGMSCILGDEMGLGKTLQTLSLFAHIKETSKDVHDPHLIICPLSVLSSWMAEAARWVPSLRAIRFHGPATERSRLKDSIRMDEESFDILITTYEAYVTEDTWFKSRRWTYCVLDEGHKIKNAETNIAHKVQGIGSLFRLVLTGTPVQNNLVELWSLLHWLYPSVFRKSSEEIFKDSFNLERGTYSLPFLAATQNLLSTIMLRRTKATVELEVPPKETLAVFLPLTELQRFWTYKLLTRLDNMELSQIFTSDINPENEIANQGRREVLSHVENQMKKVNVKDQGSNQWKRLMNLLMQLRQVCDHPYLLPDVEPSPFFIGEHIVAGSSKLIAIDKLLADLLPKGEKVLIFSQWTGMLDLLEDFMELRSIPYARLDGSTPRARRTLDIKLFQQEKSPYKVFLVSTKAGGLGINLTKATTVIMCDSDWNPQNDLQAIARAHRIGQTKVVKVYQLICRGSVEDQMLDRIRRKLFLSVKVMTSDANDNAKGASLGYNEVINILRRGSSALSNVSDGMDLARFLDARIEEILAESRSREDVREAKMKHELEDKHDNGGDDRSDEQLLKDAEKEEAKLLSGIAQVKCRLFEGKVVNRVKDNKAIAMEWQDLQSRDRVDRIVMVDGMPFILDTGPAMVLEEKKVTPEKEKRKRTFDRETWCIYCRDGGHLFLCSYCPRVFHAECRGISTKPKGAVVCGQHACTTCGRSTSESGGMLFRCQTCPDAYCEDCMPEGDIDAIGDVLPEFESLGFQAKGSVYYIRCHRCHHRFAKDPELWEEWQRDPQETQIP